MGSSSPAQVTIRKALREWWRDRRARYRRFRTLAELFGNFWDFLRSSTPEQRRRRFGDADFDWDNHVNTTSGTVSWRDRLLGIFSSGYQPSEPALFHEMMHSLPVDFRTFAFVDLGSGKGRALMMASDYPFRRIVGVEFLPDLHCIAEENLRMYDSASRKCFDLQCICEDVRQFEFPADPLLIYLFNPFLESVLLETITRLERSLKTQPRPIFIVYHSPLLQEIVTRNGVFAKVSGTNQYSIFANQGARSMLAAKNL